MKQPTEEEAEIIHALNKIDLIQCLLNCDDKEGALIEVNNLLERLDDFTQKI